MVLLPTNNNTIINYYYQQRTCTGSSTQEILLKPPDTHAQLTMRPSLAGYAPWKRKFQAVTALLLSICVLSTPCTAVGQSEDGFERVEEGATAVAVSGPLLSSLSTRLALNASAEQLAAGVPACKAVRVAQDSKYLQWLLSASVVPGNEPQTGGPAPVECASMAVR
jgi:hypothetical protein